MNINSKIPVYILSGFLGSGKTTVLIKMLEHCKANGQNPGIILNELGQENVEGHLFEDKKVVELLNGCICCTIQDDLKETMNDLVAEMESNPLDVLFIEGTGVANPLEIQEVLLTDPYMNQFEIMSIITVLDASHFREYQSIFASSSEVRKLIKEQIICGSLLLLNKTDLIGQEEIQKVIRKIIQIGGDESNIIQCKFGQVDNDLLFEKRFQSFMMNPQNTDIVQEHEHHHSFIQAIKLEDIPSFPIKSYEKWFKGLPSNVLRGKGYIEIEQTKELLNFQYASNKVTFTKIPTSVPKKSIIILIGTDLNNEAINEHCKYLLEGIL
ncbi:CobW family GTP-binding protein [Psychrobacillus soli]|uniref:GTP-binding protein n=1 Tax=Psychrobacillus soli TaxID=1543965 RepID=A0A544SKX0_9BACI|nr:GTP-binding protein [Psychrobacillus soli]TQR05801.1 GTP-binding protein [Psychrobacillus soli]